MSTNMYLFMRLILKGLIISFVFFLYTGFSIDIMLMCNNEFMAVVLNTKSDVKYRVPNLYTDSNIKIKIFDKQTKA